VCLVKESSRLIAEKDTAHFFLALGYDQTSSQAWCAIEDFNLGKDDRIGKEYPGAYFGVQSPVCARVWHKVLGGDKEIQGRIIGAGPRKVAVNVTMRELAKISKLIQDNSNVLKLL
jgi:hypothetical protein